MRRSRSSISKGKSYKEIGEFWDSHDLSDYWGQTRKAEFEVNIDTELTYYSLDKKLAQRVRSVAQKRGVSADTLVNLWVQEKLQEQSN
jgi:hypothetical protein